MRLIIKPFMILLIIVLILILAGKEVIPGIVFMFLITLLILFCGIYSLLARIPYHKNDHSKTKAYNYKDAMVNVFITVIGIIMAVTWYNVFIAK